MADMFVFPTLYDPFANVHLEALASGLPVITTASAGGSELIKEGSNGFIVPAPDDSKRIAECIKELLDPVRRKTMSQDAADSVKDFTVERNAREVSALYEEAFKDK